MSTGQGLKLKIDNNIPHAFQWVIMSSASSALTIGERNKKMNMSRAAEWITVVCMPPVFIFGTAGAANVVYSKPFWSGFPWWLPVIMLAGFYPAVVFLTMGHIKSVPLALFRLIFSHIILFNLSAEYYSFYQPNSFVILFLPEAPFAAREALFNVGYKGIGVAVALTSDFSMLFVDQPWVLIAWACLQSALIAAILTFWVCLVRAYGMQAATGTKARSYGNKVVAA